MLQTRLVAGTTAGLVLSAVFAAILCLANLAETLVEPLRVDPDNPAPVTLRLPPTTLRVADEDGAIRLETITPTIARGQVVRDRVIGSIVRMYERTRRPPDAGNVAGLWFIYFVILSMMTAYLRGFTPGKGSLLRTQVGVLGMAVALLVAAKAFLLLTALPLYAVPVGTIGLWTALHLDRRTAFMMSVALAFLAASLVGFRLTAISVYLVAGVTAVSFFRGRKHAATMVLAGVFSGVAAAVTLVAAKMLFEGGFDVAQDLARTQGSDIIGSATGGLVGGIAAYVLQGLATHALGAVSRSRLMDLADLDHPLLKKIAEEAPGSWEHSRAMANLAEAAAAAIGADALLTRVGAYYHDLGKTCQSKYFVENLEAGETSPHDALEPDVSADAIMAHVVEGTLILRRGGVPEPVVEFAYTHHGTSVIEYFWHKCLEQGNPKERSESFFRYPGMRPRTKETAILMLIDSVEAAARTVDPPTKEKFEELIQRLVFVKLKQGQLDESGLTTADLRTLSVRLAETLASVHHKRIKYPWQHRQDSGQEDLPMPGAATEEDVARAREQEEHDRTGVPPASGAAFASGTGSGQHPIVPPRTDPGASPSPDGPASGEIPIVESQMRTVPVVHASPADATVPDSPAGAEVRGDTADRPPQRQRTDPPPASMPVPQRPGLVLEIVTEPEDEDKRAPEDR